MYITSALIALTISTVYGIAKSVFYDTTFTRKHL